LKHRCVLSSFLGWDGSAGLVDLLDSSCDGSADGAYAVYQFSLARDLAFWQSTSLSGSKQPIAHAAGQRRTFTLVLDHLVVVGQPAITGHSQTRCTIAAATMQQQQSTACTEFIICCHGKASDYHISLRQLLCCCM
jgi:hypothetical protein